MIVQNLKHYIGTAMKINPEGKGEFIVVARNGKELARIWKLLPMTTQLDRAKTGKVMVMSAGTLRKIK